MSDKDYKGLLGFTSQWFALGVLTEEGLRQYGATYESSRDKNTEHYRYGAFRWYLQQHRPLSASRAEELYELGASDEDSAMGEAMMADIIELPECPISVSAKAIASGRKRLIRVAERCLLLSELQALPLLPEMFSRCLASRESVVQRWLLEKAELTPAQVQILSEQGASRGVRNLASGKLRQRKQAT